MHQVNIVENILRWPGVGASSAPHGHGLSDRELTWQATGLQHDAHCGAHQLAILQRISAKHFDGAFGGRVQSLEDFQGGGFAGAIGSEEAEDFLVLDGEAHIVYGEEVLCCSWEPLPSGGVGAAHIPDGHGGCGR